MTHIIKSPKPRKQGATFAGLPRFHVFDALDPEDPGDPDNPEDIVRWVKYSSKTAYQLTAPRAGSRVEFPPDWPVTELHIRTVDPEPDPDVCTYGELEPGEWFRWVVSPPYGNGGLSLLTDDGYVEGDGRQWNHETEFDDHPVRRVSASVVEHEEPGMALVRYSNGDIELMPEHGSRHVSLEQLAALVRQGAAALAQQAASPESGEPVYAEGFANQGPEPEPAEDRCKADSRCTRPAGHGGSDD